jgi:hypothetical protein
MVMDQRCAGRRRRREKKIALFWREIFPTSASTSFNASFAFFVEVISADEIVRPS